MKQQVNFIRASNQSDGLKIDARMLVGVALCSIVILSIVSFYQAHVTGQIRSQLESTRQQAEERRLRAAQIQAQMPEPTPSPVLIAEADQRQRDVDGLRRLLDAAAGDALAQRGGFSAYFEGLARQGQPDVWFREIRFWDGGRRMELTGSALQSDRIPALVQKLAAEEAFREKTFSDFIINRPQQQPGQVDFVLRTDMPEKRADGRP